MGHLAQGLKPEQRVQTLACGIIQRWHIIKQCIALSVVLRFFKSFCHYSYDLLRHAHAYNPDSKRGSFLRGGLPCLDLLLESLLPGLRKAAVSDLKYSFRSCA